MVSLLRTLAMVSEQTKTGKKRGENTWRLCGAEAKLSKELMEGDSTNRELNHGGDLGGFGEFTTCSKARQSGEGAEWERGVAALAIAYSKESEARGRGGESGERACGRTARAVAEATGERGGGGKALAGWSLGHGARPCRPKERERERERGEIIFFSNHIFKLNLKQI